MLSPPELAICKKFVLNKKHLQTHAGVIFLQSAASVVNELK